MREQALGLLDRVSNYLDCYCIHEYVMDRVERKLFPEEPVRIVPEALADSLMDFIMDGENNLDTNLSLIHILWNAEGVCHLRHGSWKRRSAGDRDSGSA